jgi:hypothetical protein
MIVLNGNFIIHIPKRSVRSMAKDIQPYDVFHFAEEICGIELLDSQKDMLTKIHEESKGMKNPKVVRINGLYYLVDLGDPIW